MVRAMSLFIVASSALAFGFGVKVLTKMKIWCVEDMHMLKSGLK